MVQVIAREREAVLRSIPNNGFGYDPLFIPDDQGCVTDQQREQNNGQPLTSAQMSPEQKDAISHRGAAIRAMAAHFAELA